MANEISFESPNGRSNHEWETGSASALENEWRQVSATYGNQAHWQEWEIPVAAPIENRPLPLENMESQIARTHRIIRYCKQIASPIAQKILAASPTRWNETSPRMRIDRLLAEYETLGDAVESETTALETQSFGESEFSAELHHTEQAQELALSEVLAAEATHAEVESEAQSLLGTALPINLFLMGGDSAITKALPALSQANARLVGGLFHAGPLAREALALVPTIQRRAIAGLKALQGHQVPLSPERINRMFAAQTAKVLTSPSTIGKAVIRNQSIRSNTMPACPPGR